MSGILLVIIGVISGLSVLQYFLTGLHYKKNGKDKQSISEELVELLKE